MPRVGDKHYGYDKKGMKAAKDAARRSGQPMRMTRSMPKPPRKSK